MKFVDSRRRQIVMAVLLGLAAAGAAIRYWADNPSLARDIGTLMLVMWLPAVGNLVAFAVRKLVPRLRRARSFADDSPFKAQVRAEIVPGRTANPPTPGIRDCVLVIGHEGFRARTAQPLPPTAATVELELLRPALALPRLAPGTAFQVMVGGELVASGRVLPAAST